MALNINSMKSLLTKLTFMVAALTAIFICSSCNNDVEFAEAKETRPSVQLLDEQSSMNRFAEILSKVAYSRKDVREFLKEEAIKQFDKNYDVLYVKVKDMHIGNETFREILSKYATPGELETIECSVPTINIFIPNISMLNITPENLDCNDNEIPVVVPNSINNKLYINGEVVDSIAKGNVPGFHVFVVNKNSRVVVDGGTRSSNAHFRFIDPEYDNSITQTVTRTEPVSEAYVGSKAISAYNYFNKDDGSNYSKALQRDYIYYGMTPTSTKGNLNQAVTEYISFIEIDPKAYFMMTDMRETNKQSDDPEIKNNNPSRKKRDFTPQELINEIWTEGCYNLKIEIITSVSNRPIVKHLALLPNDIWEFNYERSYRHSTAFRHSKYTYTIDPKKFTAKRYYLTPKHVSFGKWDLSNESLCREVTFVEEDAGESYTYEYYFETTKVNSTKVNGDIKLGLGIGDSTNNKGNINIGIGGESNSSTTTKYSNKVIVSRTNKDDDLGTSNIYFYDPIIEGKVGNKYYIKEYSTGIVTFGMTAI